MTCETCRYWSELIAHAQGGAVYAWCLNQTAPVPNADDRYTPSHHNCPQHAEATFGAIDMPGAAEAYEEE
ncbi:hypothetical protein [Maritimibacter sp. DP1N21-5]|uniref:hypothetical protein n=1 Tax=Maritimibacter sp. DP1N21-5 TaxID=2836867 RepID=UPI001C47FD1C|nr:hypothetical protein [Maritimibacter sp. DP1N21-5]MBV7408747.1 hypothetical protein [Maritimibacter sp. DP1N21-5]